MNLGRKCVSLQLHLLVWPGQNPASELGLNEFSNFSTQPLIFLNRIRQRQSFVSFITLAQGQELVREPTSIKLVVL